MCAPQSKMYHEIQEIPEALQRLFDRSEKEITNTACELRSLDPKLVTTIARGSSDHAATYLKYAIELLANIPVASIGPSIASVYGASLKLAGTACISISQSGKSPDIIQMVESATSSGALTIALTNDAGSPLARHSASTLDIQAGPEISVAATKTFINSVVAGLLLLAHWKVDKALLDALHRLPEQAELAIQCDWHALSERMTAQNSLLVVGRGPAIGVANEVALKFKETCQIHAEAYSSAEVMHGPVSIVGEKFPVLVLVTRDASEKSIAEMANHLAGWGAEIFATTNNFQKFTPLPFIESGHPLVDPLLLIIPFYVFIEKLAGYRGLNPDLPPNLKKVTETV